MQLLALCAATASAAPQPAPLATPGAAVGPSSALKTAIAQDYPHLWQLFTELHAHPELSLQEEKTATRLAGELEALGFTVTRHLSHTGVVATLRRGSGPVVMIRADMDALPIQEATGLSYASRVVQTDRQGRAVPVMHACGHDLHMTALVGVARQLAKHQTAWRGTLMLLLQPAEEVGGGAQAMMQDHVYEKTVRPDFALALHVAAQRAAGKISFSDGLMYSSADRVTIVVHGVGSHGASPHLGKDPIVIAGYIVTMLQAVVTREISPLEPALITVGSLHAGTAANIIPDQAVLEVTLRANSPETRARLLAAVERVAKNVARAAGVDEAHLPTVTPGSDGCSTTHNDAALAARVRAALVAQLGAEALEPWQQTDMGAEDFGELLRTEPPIPGLYFEVGVTPPPLLQQGAWADTHSPMFRIAPEESITAAVTAMSIAALELLTLAPTAGTNGSTHSGTHGGTRGAGATGSLWHHWRQIHSGT